MTEYRDKLERLSTGIPGLDTITSGGFFRGGLYLIQGTPGTGKTTFVNQISFHRAECGEHVLYVTLLAEYHSRMVQYLGGMSFFDASRLPDQLCYLSAFRVMRESGLSGLLSFVRRELIARKASFLVVDGLIAAQRIATSDQAFNEFVHELQGIAIATHCTVFLVASADRNSRTTPEHTMVDGIIELSDQRDGWATDRTLQLSKVRGTAYLRGKHSYKISDAGISIFPRIEALLPMPSATDRGSDGRVSSGIPQLDDMVGGGIPAGSPTMLVGPSGVGKTTLGLHFLSQCSDTAPGLFYGFYETPARIAVKSHDICKPLTALMASGAVEMLWQPPTFDSLDSHGDRLLSAIRARGVRRLFLDGLGALQRAEDANERLRQYVPALTNELRAQGVTTIYTLEGAAVVGSPIRAPFDNFSLLAENLIVMRYVEVGPRLHRLISILKVRDSDFDPLAHEFMLTDHGIDIDSSSARAEAILRERLPAAASMPPALSMG